jgi:hypothetical protein
MTVGLVLALAVALVPAAVHLALRARRVRETGTPADHGLAFEAVRTPTVRGRYLFGWLLPPPGAARTVVVLHGWGSDAELMLPIAAPLRRAGLNALLCGARNHGQDDSDTFSSLPRFAEDLGQAPPGDRGGGTQLHGADPAIRPGVTALSRGELDGARVKASESSGLNDGVHHHWRPGLGLG